MVMTKKLDAMLEADAENADIQEKDERIFGCQNHPATTVRGRE